MATARPIFRSARRALCLAAVLAAFPLAAQNAWDALINSSDSSYRGQV
jgi:hypothetical protein